MKKKPWIVVLFALLVIAAVSFTLSSGSAKDAVPQTGNLIANGDFSILEDGQPKGWETGMWVTSAGASYLEAVTLADEMCIRDRIYLILTLTVSRILRAVEKKMDGPDNYVIHGSQSDSRADIKVCLLYTSRCV